jgi:hypothetical protein
MNGYCKQLKHALHAFEQGLDMVDKKPAVLHTQLTILF